jgi:hypothetical protein
MLALSVNPSRIRPIRDARIQGYWKIVATVGCSLHRDSVDKLLIDDLTSLGIKRKIINSPDDMGGFVDRGGTRAQ